MILTQFTTVKWLASETWFCGPANNSSCRDSCRGICWPWSIRNLGRPLISPADNRCSIICSSIIWDLRKIFIFLFLGLLRVSIEEKINLQTEILGNDYNFREYVSTDPSSNLQITHKSQGINFKINRNVPCLP